MKEIKKLSQYNSKKKKNPKNYKYWSLSTSEMLSSSSPNVWWCGEGWGGGGGGRRWWRRCIGQRTTTLRLLEVTVHGRHPLLHKLYLLRPLFLIPLVALIQLYVPPVGLLELPLHRFIQCINMITDVLRIGPSKPSFRYRAWRIWPPIRGPHPVYMPLVAATNSLGPYLIVTNRWAGRSAPIPLLQLLRSGLS